MPHYILSFIISHFCVFNKAAGLNYSHHKHPDRFKRILLFVYFDVCLPEVHENLGSVGDLVRIRTN